MEAAEIGLKRNGVRDVVDGSVKQSSANRRILDVIPDGMSLM